jgi:peptidoglycan L-alanyl-D-glutamate endopeptidase CwlK
MKLTERDLKKLKEAHPDLNLVLTMAARTTTIPFMVMEVERDAAQQRANIKKGVSWTMRSRHLPSKDGLARAADLVPIDAKGKPIWAWPVYYKLAVIIKAAAKQVKIPIEWGGDWKKNKDGPHWQLPWKLYP